MQAAINDFAVIPNGTATATPKQGLTKQDIKTLIEAGVIPSDCPEAQIRIFAQIAAEKGLSPFNRQLAIIGFYSKDKGCNIYTIITTNEGWRTLINRTGRYAGCEPTTFNNNLSWYEMQEKVSKEGIAALKTCTFSAYYLDGRGNKNRYTKTVSFVEFSTNKMKWLSMPLQMIEKVSKSFAYKEMLGDEGAGLSIAEEAGAMSDGNVGHIAITEQDDALTVEAQTIVASCNTKDEVRAAMKAFKIKHGLGSFEYCKPLHKIFNDRYKELTV